MTHAWVLNLDADLELALGPGYTPPKALAAQLWSHAAALAATLPEGDVWIEGVGDPRGLQGACWCPTPSALERLEASGAHPPPAPSLTILRRVNGRSFAYGLHPLEGERRIDSPADAERALESGRWIVHREHAFAGRGHRFIDGPPSDAERAWIRKGLGLGPLFAAPRLELALEVALHGRISSGSTERGVVTVQRTDRLQWQRSVRAPDALSVSETRTLHEAFDQTAEALREAGYLGPFGIDAFRHEEGFHPLGEINARYSMGWAIGMGGW